METHDVDITWVSPDWKSSTCARSSHVLKCEMLEMTDTMMSGVRFLQILDMYLARLSMEESSVIDIK